MHVEFTEEERRYLVADPFNWHTSADAPKDVKKAIAQKMAMINKQKAGVGKNLRAVVSMGDPADVPNEPSHDLKAAR